MSYRCSVCSAVRPPKQPRLMFCIYRDVPAKIAPHVRQEIQQELPVCLPCYGALTSGLPLTVLRANVARTRAALAAAEAAKEEKVIQDQPAAGTAGIFSTSTLAQRTVPRLHVPPPDLAAPVEIGEEVASDISFNGRLAEAIGETLKKVRVGTYGKIVLVPAEKINGTWQGGRSLGFKHTRKEEWKFGTVIFTRLEEAVAFVLSHFD